MRREIVLLLSLLLAVSCGPGRPEESGGIRRCVVAPAFAHGNPNGISLSRHRRGHRKCRLFAGGEAAFLSPYLRRP